MYKILNALPLVINGLRELYGKVYMGKLQIQLKHEGTSRQSNVILYLLIYKSPFQKVTSSIKL